MLCHSEPTLYTDADADADPPEKTTSAAQPEQPLFALATVTNLLSAYLALEDGPKRPRVAHAADKGEDVRVRFDGRIDVVAGRHLAVSDGRETQLGGVVELSGDWYDCVGHELYHGRGRQVACTYQIRAECEQSLQTWVPLGSIPRIPVN